MSGLGVHYLLAVTPRVADDHLDPAGERSRPLDEAEGALVRRLAAEGVEFGLHGCDHRTRRRSPRHRSEFAGLDGRQLAALLDRCASELQALGAHPRVLVPPFNRFEADQYDVMAERFDVVCGGPETVARVGFHPTPRWLGEAVYLPAYAPLYGPARTILEGVVSLVASRASIWVPLVIHWPWEAKAGFDELARLAERIAPYATPWSDFLAAVDGSRHGSP
jgi:peptidoglycan/xylan/chitin deacetylase (PgdA/CDA1 family)